MTCYVAATADGDVQGIIGVNGNVRDYMAAGSAAQLSPILPAVG